jgi:sugar/nucleoside kinase (ribokinase family)
MQFPLELVTDKQFAAVGFGLNAVDHLIVVPEYPAFDTKMRFIEHQQSAGGQTATAMVALRRLGLKTAYAGRFGADAEGRFGLRTLIDDDVNVDFAEVVEGARNQIAFITIDARSGERTIVWDRDDRLAYKPDEAPVEFSTIGRVLHLDAHDPPACVRMGAAGRAAGPIVYADSDKRYPRHTALMPNNDILIG